MHRLITLAALIATLSPAAHAKGLECRETIDGEFKGTLTAIQDQGAVTVSTDPGLLLNNYKYELVHVHGSHAVLLGKQTRLSLDWSSPLVVISLDFSAARVFVYRYIGGTTESDTSESRVQWSYGRVD